VIADIISLADARALRAAAKPSVDNETEKAAILRLTQQIADNFGIDPEAPFRRKPVE
jgi:hypothetical protein